jgi:hypothetical protein
MLGVSINAIATNMFLKNYINTTRKAKYSILNGKLVKFRDLSSGGITVFLYTPVHKKNNTQYRYVGLINTAKSFLSPSYVSSMHYLADATHVFLLDISSSFSLFLTLTMQGFIGKSYRKNIFYVQSPVQIPGQT